MRRRPRRITSPVRLLRAIWRYRGTLAAHGDRYQTELAVAVRSSIEANLAGSVGLAGYRATMRVLFLGAVALGVVAVVVALALWQLTPWLAVLALAPLVGAAFLAWWRFSLGRPLDWLDEHDDPARTVTIAELPTRLRELAQETRGIANVPARLADELEALAGDTADAPGPVPLGR